MTEEQKKWCDDVNSRVREYRGSAYTTAFPVLDIAEFHKAGFSAEETARSMVGLAPDTLRIVIKTSQEKDIQ